jgi:hypothetical protein
MVLGLAAVIGRQAGIRFEMSERKSMGADQAQRIGAAVTEAFAKWSAPARHLSERMEPVNAALQNLKARMRPVIAALQETEQRRLHLRQQLKRKGRTGWRQPRPR